MRTGSAKWFAICVALVLLLAATDGLQAQTRGRIVGRVTDSGTSVALVGANVMVSGTNLGAATDRFGDYRIDNVPFGSYTLVVTYIGYERNTAQVSVSGPAVTQDITLKSVYNRNGRCNRLRCAAGRNQGLEPAESIAEYQERGI